MNRAQEFGVSIAILVGIFLGVLILGLVAWALPAPLNRFGILLPGTWVVVVFVNWKTLPERVWAVWLKLRPKS